MGIRQGAGVHTWQVPWLGIQGQDLAFGRRQPKVQRTLGHQGPNIGLGVKAGHCPGSGLGCWAGLQILIQGEKPRQSPRLTTQTDHQREEFRSQLASWLAGLDCDRGSKGPFSCKGAWVGGRQRRRSGTWPQVFPAWCPGFFISLLHVGQEGKMDRWGPEAVSHQTNQILGYHI